MRAVRIREPGGPEVLQLGEVPTPAPSAGQIRVAVHGAGINRADLLQRRGAYPAPPGSPQDVPGLEYAGTVDAVGDGGLEWNVGDRVMGLVGGGGYAEYVVVHEREALPVPEALSMQEAAGTPEVFVTAHDALFTRGRLGPGETLLINAVGSGVGTAALQLAKAIGARVIGTSRTAEKLERAGGLGLDVAIRPEGEAFADAVLDATDGDGVDLVLELVGGSYVAEGLRAVALRGRIVLVGLVGGSAADLDLSLLLRRRVELIGTVLRSRPLEERIAAAQALRRHVLPLLAAGRVLPEIDRVLTFAEAAEAHRLMEANANFGKIVLVWD